MKRRRGEGIRVRSRVGGRQDYWAKVKVVLSQRERCRAATDRENPTESKISSPAVTGSKNLVT